MEVVKTREFCHFCPFSWAIAHCFGSGDDFDDLWPSVNGKSEVVKTREFCHFCPFSWAKAHCFGSGDDFDCLWTPVHGNLEVIKTREFCHFWPFSWARAHGFQIFSKSIIYLDFKFVQIWILIRFLNFFKFEFCTDSEFVRIQNYSISILFRFEIIQLWIFVQILKKCSNFIFFVQVWNLFKFKFCSDFEKMFKFEICSHFQFLFLFWKNV